MANLLFGYAIRHCGRIRKRFIACLLGLAVGSITIAVWVPDGHGSNQNIGFAVSQQRDFAKPQMPIEATLQRSKRISLNNTKHSILSQHRDADTPMIIRWDEFGLAMADNIKCGARQCHVTNNRDVRHHHEVLAILFSGTHFGSSGLPLPRKPGHLWSVMHNESPKNNDWLFSAKDAMNLFNLTSTFRRESHYPTPTVWLRNGADLTNMEYVVPVEQKNQYRREGFAPVVFVHSDCPVPSDRSHYMRLLQKYIKIDSYGSCEHNKDFPNVNMTGIAKMFSQEMFKLLAKYKFVLSFENAVCDDYITEKFWRPLHLGVVPITFGSPTVKDFAPSDHSVIDIRDFRSVKKVADYISYLDSHDDEYRKYLDFKQTGIRNPNLKTHLDQRTWGYGKTYITDIGGFECFICEKLHKLGDQMMSGQTVEQWQGAHNHYGCPDPMLFDEEGRYMVHPPGRRSGGKHYAEYYLQSIRYHINNNIHAGIQELHTFARGLMKHEDFKKRSN